MIMGGEFKLKKKESVWWKDMMATSLPKTNDIICFAGNVSFELGDGNNILFWYGRWFGGTPLKGLFPLLFTLSSKPLGSARR